MLALVVLAAGLLVFLIMFVVTGGHVIFLPLLLFLPLGIISFGARRR
jgi:hypothetical protein